MFRQNYFDLADSKAIKAILSIMILAHHIFQISGIEERYGHIIYYMFISLGYISVSVFYFISGYGLTCKDKKKEHYDICFFRWFIRNILPIYCIYIVLNICYASVWIFLDKTIVSDIILKSLFLGGKCFIKNGWFFQVIILLYVLYGISRRMKNKLVFLLISVGVYFGINYYLGRGYWWYVGIFAFVVGVLYSQYRTSIDKFLRINYRKTLLFMIVMVIMLYVLCDTYIFFMPILAVFFPLLVVLSCTVINYESRFTNLVGNYYLSIYAVQGIPIIIWTHLNPPMCPFYCMIFVSITTIVLSLFVNPLFFAIVKFFKSK